MWLIKLATCQPTGICTHFCIIQYQTTQTKSKSMYTSEFADDEPCEDCNWWCSINSWSSV